jgi:hypothetical protein
MSIDDDRRIEGSTRIPFEVLVEVGGSLGPTFEAQAIDLSEEGMHLRTAYLPEVGQPLTCRFEAGSATVMTAGEVVWREEAGRGGEFGLRFTNLDPESAGTLDRILGLAKGSAPHDTGARVRLHIDGLGSPMRARVKEAKLEELRVGSELGFLQVGKQLELEDAATGSKRPARIDRVEIETDPSSHIPQLVVTLRYDEEAAEAASPPRREAAESLDGLSASSSAHAEEAKESTPDPAVIDQSGAPEEVVDMPAVAATQQSEDIDALRKASGEMKGAIARGASRVGPALTAFARRARTALALLAARRMRDTDETAIPLRRITSPPPGGGLHAAGRRVVRRDSAADAREVAAPRSTMMRRKVVGGAVVATAAVISIVAMHRSTPPTSAAIATPEQPAAAAAPPPAAPAAQAPLNAGPLPTPPPSPVNGAALATPPAADVEDGAGASDKHHKVHVAPFGSGAVAHANVIRLKMDGVIEKLEGANTPTGFSVRVPNRRSLEAAAPLAARDGRIASMHVSNEANGAELNVTFKDGVPNFQVRAHADALEILLAPAGRLADDHVDEAPPKRAESAAAKKRHKKHTD